MSAGSEFHAAVGAATRKLRAPKLSFRYTGIWAARAVDRADAA